MVNLIELRVGSGCFESAIGLKMSGMGKLERVVIGWNSFVLAFSSVSLELNGVWWSVAVTSRFAFVAIAWSGFRVVPVLSPGCVWECFFACEVIEQACLNWNPFKWAGVRSCSIVGVMTVSWSCEVMKWMWIDWLDLPKLTTLTTQGSYSDGTFTNPRHITLESDSHPLWMMFRHAQSHRCVSFFKICI